MQIRFAGRTDVGLLRERNEDSLVLVPDYRFAAVADGMGGHLSGDVASALAVATVEDFYAHTVGPDRTWPFPYDTDLTEEENCVVTGLRLANRRVFSQARKSDSDAGMGTTIVAVMFTQDAKQVIIGHVGDSRCYRIRDGAITQLTSDHSLVSEVTEIAPWLSEEEVAQLPKNVITRALGMSPDVLVDLLTTNTKPDDTYLLCSDGLNGMVTDELILETVSEHGDALDDTCQSLIKRANEAGGLDNTTVVLAKVDLEPDEEFEPIDEEGDTLPAVLMDDLPSSPSLDDLDDGGSRDDDSPEQADIDDTLVEGTPVEVASGDADGEDSQDDTLPEGNVVDTATEAEDGGEDGDDDDDDDEQ